MNSIYEQQLQIAEQLAKSRFIIIDNNTNDEMDDDMNDETGENNYQMINYHYYNNYGSPCNYMHFPNYNILRIMSGMPGLFYYT